MDRTQVLFSFNFFSLFSSPCQRQCELITNRSSSILFLRHWWFSSYVPWKCEIFDNLKFQTNNFSLKRNNYTPAPPRSGVYCFTSVRPSKIFFVALNIYARFWTHRSPTSCLTTLLIVIHIEHIYANFSSHFFEQLLMTGIWYLVTSFI